MNEPDEVARTLSARLSELRPEEYWSETGPTLRGGST
jgi:hypothetical protein